MTNEPLTPTTSNSLNAFVNSVADLEIRHYTLLETAKKIKAEARSKAYAEERLQKAQSAFEKSKTNKQHYQYLVHNQSFKEYRKENYGFEKLVRPFIVILGVILAIGGFGIIFYLFNVVLELKNGNFTAVVPILIVPFIVYLIQRIIIKRNYLRNKSYNKCSLDKATESYEQAQQELALAQESYDEAQKDILLLNKKAEELENSAVIVRNNLTKCYELGVIPPSYRNMICVVLINDIFMNNKADSMRDAILLCDIEIRHAEIVNKLNDINHSLQTLATSIQSMNSLLCDINYNINSMSSDISVLGQQQERIAYATESIQRSAENADFYIAQRRAGSL